MQGLIGRKIGMTRIFDKDTGYIIPVTIVKTGMNTVQQVKTVENDGYSAVQLGFETCKESKAGKAVTGHSKKHNSEPARIVREFKLDSPEEAVECGKKVGPEIFNDVTTVDVSGTSKGRGYAGTVKKYGFHIGPLSHGNKNKRERGSLGANTYPARVFPFLKMAGQYGNERVTMKGIRIIGLDTDNGLVYLKGSIPGKNKGIVFIKKGVSR